MCHSVCILPTADLEIRHMLRCMQRRKFSSILKSIRPPAIPMTKDTFTSDRREHVTSFLFLFLFRVHDDSSSCGRMSVLECREIIFVENFIVIYLSRFRFLPTELSVCGGTVNFSRLGGFNHSISDVAFANFLKYT